MAAKNQYRHSVELDPSKCVGCTSCLKHCPTEAIRIKDGRAEINPNRCVDCSECIRVCTHGARSAQSSKLEHYMGYKWKIALPAPVLFGQFEGLEDPDPVLQGLLDIGFDEVFEVAQAAELVSAYTRLYLKTEGIRKPVISSACPVIPRLISMRFPYLRDNVLPLLPPVEVAAIMAKERAKKAHPELKDDEIGTYFISPCAAKVSYIRNGCGDYKSNVDVVVSMSEIYFMLLGAMKRSTKEPTVVTGSGKIGIGWASSGGEATAILNDRYLAADGIENVIDILDKIENGHIPNIDFIELDACTGGCVGGIMTIENAFIAKTRLQSVRRYLPVSKNYLPEGSMIPDYCFTDAVPQYEPMTRLGSTMSETMHMMTEIQRIRAALPGIDCGACGAPTCKAFAEDMVKGRIRNMDECVVLRSGILDRGGDGNDDSGAGEGT